MLRILIFIILPALCIAQNANIQIIDAGSLLAAQGEKSLSKQTIVIEDITISLIKSRYSSSSELAYAGVDIPDLKDKFVPQSLIDMPRMLLEKEIQMPTGLIGHSCIIEIRLSVQFHT